MIRLINCVAKRQGLSDVDFRRYWSDPQFEVLVRRIAEYFRAMRVQRSLTLQIGLNQDIIELRGTAAPFAGTIEYWWKEGAIIDTLRASDDWQGLEQEMYLYQVPFVDFASSRAFFTEA